MGVTEEQVAVALDAPGVTFWHNVGDSIELNIEGNIVEATAVERDGADDEFTHHVWFTFQIGEQYFRRYGIYRSHCGDDWDDGETLEVFPLTKVIEGFYPA